MFNYFKFNPKHRKIFGLAVMLFVFSASVFIYQKANGSIYDNVAGFAWGADEAGAPSSKGGIGWISFNSKDCDADNNGFIDGPGANTLGYDCGSNNSSIPVVNYGVNLDFATGYLTGYAWAPEVGWIKFGGFSVSEFPVGTGPNAMNAKVDFTGTNPFKVYGWARICAYAQNSITCRGNASQNAKTGGVDGWISLNSEGIDPNGNPSVYSVFYNENSKVFSGYAWAGDSGEFNTPPVCPSEPCKRFSYGWIAFNGTGPNFMVRVDDLTGPHVNITASPNPVPIGGTSVLSWSGINLKNAPDGCEASDGVGDANWTSPNTKNSPSGTFITIGLPQGSHVYSIKCMDMSGVFSPLASVTVLSGDTTQLDFYAEPSVATPPNFETMLKWRDDPDVPGLSGCVADSAPPLNIATVPSWTGNVANPSSSANATVSVPYDTTKYKITCNNATGGQLTQTISVKRSLGESVKLSATKPIGGISTLSWVTTNMVVDSCHPTSSPNIPTWQAPDPKTPTNSGSDNDVVVPSTGTTAYTLTCTGLYSGQDIAVTIYAKGGKFGKPGYKEN